MYDQINRAMHFTVLMDGVIDDERLGKNEILVYMALCRFSDKERTAFPGIRTLADKARLSPNTVQQALQNLQSFGYLEIENRNRGTTQAKTSNLYTLVEVCQPLTQGVSATDTPPVSATDTEVDPSSEEDTKKEEDPSISKPSLDKREPQFSTGARGILRDFENQYGMANREKVVAAYKTEKPPKKWRFADEDLPVFIDRFKKLHADERWRDGVLIGTWGSNNNFIPSVEATRLMYGTA